MQITETRLWMARQADDARLWVANNKKHFKPWITKKAAPVVLESAASGAFTALVARLFTTVPPTNIGIFTANLTMVSHVANGVFKYDNNKLLEGETKDVFMFAGKTVTVVYVPGALTRTLGYQVSPSDYSQMMFAMMAIACTAAITGLLISTISRKQPKPVR